jgi:hypothetical protein
MHFAMHFAVTAKALAARHRRDLFDSSPVSPVKQSTPERNAMVTVSAKLADGRSISAKFPEVNTIAEGITALTAELQKAKIEPSTVTQVVARTKSIGKSDRLKINDAKPAKKGR